jgi:hypothetical protein
LNRERRYRVLLATLTLALVVGIVAAMAVSRPVNGRTPDSAVSLQVYLGWFSPYLVAVMLSLSRRQRAKSIASVVALLGAAYCTFGSFVLFRLGGRPLWREPLFALFAASHIAVAVAALRTLARGAPEAL